MAGRDDFGGFQGVVMPVAEDHDMVAGGGQMWLACVARERDGNAGGFVAEAERVRF